MTQQDLKRVCTIDWNDPITVPVLGNPEDYDLLVIKGGPFPDYWWQDVCAPKLHPNHVPIVVPYNKYAVLPPHLRKKRVVVK